RVLAPKTSGRIVFAQFFAEIDRREQASAMLMAPNLASSIEPRQRLLVVDTDGGVTVWDLEQGRHITDKPLLKGARPLEVGGQFAALAIRRPNDGDAVIDLTSGEPMWQAEHPTAHFHGFAGDGRFIVVEDGGIAHLESLYGGNSVHVEDSRPTLSAARYLR